MLYLMLMLFGLLAASFSIDFGDDTPDENHSM